MTTSRDFVFKVATRAAWETASIAGLFHGSADDARDGFIHMSLQHQLPGTLAKHFRGQDDLILIQFEAHKLGEALRWEISRGGEEFPHLYAPLPTVSALSVHALHLDANGIPQLPKEFTCR